MTTGHIENSNSPYTPIRSAFTLIEKPLRFCYDRYISHPEGLQNLKNPYYLGAAVAYHIVVCAAPVTMVADMVIGIAECIFCILVRGDSLRDVAELARKKIVVSPLHHLIFLIANLAVPACALLLVFYTAQGDFSGYILRINNFSWSWIGAAKRIIFTMGIGTYLYSLPLVRGEKDVEELLEMPAPLRPFTMNRLVCMATQTIFVALASCNFTSLGVYTFPALTILKISILPITFSSFIWTWNYTLSQRMIGSLSPSWNHRTFSIFIGQGAQIKMVGTKFSFGIQPGKTFQDLAFEDSQSTYSYFLLKLCTVPCPPHI